MVAITIPTFILMYRSDNSC